jgi:hypothetical protein
MMESYYSSESIQTFSARLQRDYESVLRWVHRALIKRKARQGIPKLICPDAPEKPV